MAATAAARRIHRAASERGISVRARRDKAQRGGSVSDMSIKEKDAMNMRTLTRWGIGTLESVERPKTCIIRLTFDTIRKDKRERQYEMEAKPCQALERMLRDYLSSKPLSEMNQTVFKCLKCNSEFSREKDERKRRDVGECQSANSFVAII